MSYRNCTVPQCKSSSIKTPEKLFIHVPRNEDKRKTWLNLAGREANFSSQTAVYFCEDHFDLPTDMLNYMEYKVMGSIKRILVSDDCLPTKFECQAGREGTLSKRAPRSPVTKRLRSASKRQRAEKTKVKEEPEEQTDLEGKPSNDPNHPDYVPSIFTFNTSIKKEETLPRRGKKRLAVGKGESILIKNKGGVNQAKNVPGSKKRMIDDGSGSSREKQRQIANGTLPDVAAGESTSSAKKDELEGRNSSQSDPAASVAEVTTDEPPPKVAKTVAPSLIVEGPRQRKPTQPFSPVQEVGKPRPKFPPDYVFEGKRLVNMGYFIKSLQALNDHDGRKCNFSDMRVCSETKKGWNVGVMLTCKLCPTTKIIWMEDPDMKRPPQMPIIFKPTVTVVQPTQASSLVGAPTATLCTTYPTTVPLAPPAPKTQKRPRQPYWSKRKTPTPPPDEDSPPEHFLQEHASPPEVTVPMPKYPPNTLLVRPGTTVHYGLPQTPYPGQLLVRPVIGQQVPTMAQSQRSIINQSPVPVISQSPVPFVGQTPVPFVDFPQVTSIKQEVILPDDGTNPPFINSSRVEMTFCVEQDEATAASESVTCDTAMDVTENIAATPDAFALTRTSLQGSSGQSSSSTAMDANVTSGIAPTDTLPVDLNLVKKEVDD